MNKANRLYKIFMTSMIVIVAGLLLATGIIAVQKSMKMKLSFPVTPNFLFEVYIQKEGSAMPEDPVFRNFEKSKTEGIVMQNGLSTLQSNTLSADGSFFTTYGDEFSIIIANYSTTMGISVSVTSTATLENDAAGVPAEITAVSSSAAKYSGSGDASEVKFDIANKAVFPQQTLLEIRFEELVGYIVAFDSNGGNGVMDNVFVSVGQEYTMPENGFVFNGYWFDSWNTKYDGTGESYEAGMQIEDFAESGELVVLYAQWTKLAYKTFNFTFKNASDNHYLYLIVTNNDNFKITNKAIYSNTGIGVTESAPVWTVDDKNYYTPIFDGYTAGNEVVDILKLSVEDALLEGGVLNNKGYYDVDRATKSNTSIQVGVFDGCTIWVCSSNGERMMRGLFISSISIPESDYTTSYSSMGIESLKIPVTSNLNNTINCSVEYLDYS